MSNIVRTFYPLEELEKEYVDVNSSSEQEILQTMDDIQLQRNMNTSISSAKPNPSLEASGLGTGQSLTRLRVKFRENFWEKAILNIGLKKSIRKKKQIFPMMLYNLQI